MPRLDPFLLPGPDERRTKWRLILGVLLSFMLLFGAGFLVWHGNSFSSRKQPAVPADLTDYDKDSDSDGLSDLDEKSFGTDPLKSDTDQDGYSDREEILAGYNPLGAGKLDNRTIAAAEANTNQTKNEAQRQKLDNWIYHFSQKSGGDGGFNTVEERYADADSDGVNNIMEQIYGTDPRQADTDGDGKSDKAEINNNENPLGPGTIPEEINLILKGAVDNLLFFDRCDQMRFQEDPSVDDGDDCLIASAILTNKTAFCDKTKSGEYDERGDCYTNLAMINADEKYCAYIPRSEEPGSFNDQRSKCYEKIALLRLNEAICANIDFGPSGRSPDDYARYGCYTKVAAATGNYSLCQEMLPLIEKDMVTYYLNNNDYNRKIPTNYIDQTRNEPNRILLDVLKIDNYNDCIAHIPAQYQSVSTCDIFSVASVKDDCLTEFARRDKNPELCVSITTPAIKDKCQAAVGAQGSSVGSCALINDSNLRDQCYIGVAKNKKDPQICRQASPAGKNSCFNQLALELKDEKICSLMTVNQVDENNCRQKEGSAWQSCSEYARDICYYKVGIAKKDQAVCRTIINDFRQKNCLDIVK